MPKLRTEFLETEALIMAIEDNEEGVYRLLQQLLPRELDELHAAALLLVEATGNERGLRAARHYGGQ